MARTTRTTLVSTNARIDGLETRLDRVIALLGGEAKPVGKTRKAAPKVTARKATARKATTAKAAKNASDTPWNGTRKDRTRWNDCVMARARFAGKVNGVSVLSAISGPGWTVVQEARAEGKTPNQVIAAAKRSLR